MSDSVLFEILDKKSQIFCGADCVYFGHQSIFLHLQQERKCSFFKEQGRRSGLLPEDELLKDAVKNGGWSKEKEDLMKLISWEVGKMMKAYDKITDPSIKKNNLERLEQRKKDLAEIKAERDSICSFSLERYVTVKSSFFICRENLFYDESLTENISETDAQRFVPAYIEKSQELGNRDNILRAAFRPEIFDFFSIYKNAPGEIIKGSIYEMTFFQKDLIVYGNYLFQKLSNNDVPDWARTDAVRLFEWKREDKETEDVNIRKIVEKAGGVDKIRPEDKLT